MINNHILWNSLFLSLTVTLTGNCCCCAFSIINYNLQKSHIDNSCDVKLATLLGLFNNNSLGQKQQEVKVIWCKAVSLPYMDSSIVFARLSQCSPPSSTLQSASSAPYRCCPLLSCFEYIDHWTCLDMSCASPFLPSKLLLQVSGSGPHLIHGSLGSPKSTSWKASWSVQPLLQGSRSWPTLWQTDHATPSVAIGRI